MLHSPPLAGPDPGVGAKSAIDNGIDRRNLATVAYKNLSVFVVHELDLEKESVQYQRCHCCVPPLLSLDKKNRATPQKEL